MEISKEDFERCVVEALESLPRWFQERLDNVEVVVENWPDPLVLQKAGVQSPAQLLGFYHGIPQTRRPRRYGLVLPDKISIYRGPIALRCRSEEQLKQLVRHVVLHELAHHFGIDDNRLREIGAY